MDDESTQINLLQKLYKDKNSGLFLLKNTQDIYREAKRHAELASVTRETIEKFKVSSLSKELKDDIHSDPTNFSHLIKYY